MYKYEISIFLVMEDDSFLLSRIEVVSFNLYPDTEEELEDYSASDFQTIKIRKRVL